MPSYRVEVSPNNRAGCQDALCKKNGDKITKGEIRFGAWVEGTSGFGHEFQGWKWRHWGCVSGKTLQNIRENLTGGLADEDEYQWDNMDGLEDMPQDFQEKIKRAIIKGKIADEDWKGDPAYNVLGKTGIRGRATPKKKEPEESEEVVESVVAAEALATPVGKKRGRARDEDQDEKAKPTKKRIVKAKKDESDGDGAKPTRKRRARKSAKKEEESDDEEWMKQEQDAKKDTYMKPAMKSKAKRGAKKEVDTEFTGFKTEEDNEAIINVKPARKARVNKDIKEETIYETQVKTEGSGRVNVDIKPAKNVRGKKAAKEEETNGGSLMKKEEDEHAAVDANLKLKHEAHDNFNAVKREEGSDISFSARETHAAVSGNEEGTNKAEMPEDPRKQIALAFCDREGPLVGEFSQMVQAQEVAGDDWEGFLQKKFRNMTDAGEIGNDNFDGFLQMMHDREVAFREPVPVAPKRGRKRKDAPITVAKSRPRRSKAS